MPTVAWPAQHTYPPVPVVTVITSRIERDLNAHARRLGCFAGFPLKKAQVHRSNVTFGIVFLVECSCLVPSLGSFSTWLQRLSSHRSAQIVRYSRLNVASISNISYSTIFQFESRIHPPSALLLLLAKRGLQTHRTATILTKTHFGH